MGNSCEIVHTTQIGAKDANTVLASFAPTFEAIGIPILVCSSIAKRFSCILYMRYIKCMSYCCIIVTVLYAYRKPMCAARRSRHIHA